MKHRTRVAFIVLTIAVGLAMTGCATPADTPVPDAAGGSQLAQGLHELGDGTAQAVGVLEFQDLEGGFWAVTGSTPDQAGASGIIVVIANAQDLGARVDELAGSQVIVTGTLLDGASIRMAGPEMEATSIEAYQRGDGAAE